MFRRSMLLLSSGSKIFSKISNHYYVIKLVFYGPTKGRFQFIFHIGTNKDGFQ
jgi:hypothetical protein